ncbi:death domain associated protein [Senna tora]|uniref:Death domain associated protein n=1 Tax=Senna tora TaxID=362788 RepID=A0A834XH72_9FABA|nr:death domain associated protein [Senna tora]
MGGDDNDLRLAHQNLVSFSGDEIKISVGDLGHTLQSNPQRRRELGGKGAQINGSDVLWALQRASARKEMKMRKKKKQRRMEEEEEEEDLSSARRSTEESGVDDGDVREVCIKSEWGDRLDELEERLQELSRII